MNEPLTYPLKDRVTQAVRALQIVKTYATREEYRADKGVDPPEYDPKRPPQFWEDATAVGPKYRMYLGIATDEFGKWKRGSDGLPYMEMFPMLQAYALHVNIPPSMANVEGADNVACQVPCRGLRADESLGWGQIPMDPNEFPVVINNAIKEDLEVPTPYTKADKALLQAIAKKIGV